MTDNVLLTVAEYRTAIHGLSQQAREARMELDSAHRAQADAEASYRRGQAVAWSEVEGTAAEREAKVQAACADLRKARDIARGRIDVARSHLRDCSDRRMSLDQLARWSTRVADIDRAGPDLTPLTRTEVPA